jgi:hypothetical protein
MALTQEQVDWWFSQNPDATAEDVAAAVKSVGGLEANAGLAGMLANRFSIAEPEVTNYYNAYVGAQPPTTPTTNTDTQTFTDTILSGGDTTQDDLLATLTDSTAGTTGADTTGTTTTTPTTYTKSFGGTDYSLATADVDFLVNQILNQNLTSQWKGEGFGSPEANARAMAENLLASGITNINQVGQKDVVIPGSQYAVDESGTMATLPDEIRKQIVNLTTGQALINDYGERGIGNAFSGTYTGEGNTAYRVKFDDKGNPYFYTTGASSSDIADWGPILSLAAVIPSPLQPFAIAANAAIAIDQGDTLGGIAALAGLAGFSDVAAGARILKAAESGDPFAIVTSVMNSPFAGDVGGTMLTDTISLRDAGNAVSVFNNAQDGNWAGALTSANQLVNSPDLATAAAAARFIDAFEKNNFAGMYAAANGFTNAMNASNKITDKNVALNLTNTLANANSAATEGTQLAGLGSDTVSDAGNGLTLSGDGGSTLNFPDFTGSDSINADAALFDSSVGDLDATGNITDTTGLDMGDVIPDGGDDVEELVVTGTDTTGLDMGEVIPDGGTETGGTVTDEGKVIITGKKESCPVGTVLNPETGECDPYWDEGGGEVCGTGQVLDPATGMCIDEKEAVVITGKRDTCPVGTKLNPETGDCDPDWDEGGGEVCDPGFHQDPETGMCVPDEAETITCPPGKVLNEAGTACIDETVIIAKPESCPVGTVLNRETGECDPIDDDKPCADGFHKDATGLCVPDDDEECKTGYEKVNGTCVPVCKEGYIRNLETGVCEKAEKECPAGQTRNAEGKCVPVTKPPVTCQPGYERIDGVCVPICQPGYQRVNGVCKKITPDTVMPTSVIGGQGEKTDPIYAGGMDSFNLLATLQDLLAEEPPKKDDKKSKDKTKMATGGHLDDLLAEQMTVDDLLKLLR